RPAILRAFSVHSRAAAAWAATTPNRNGRSGIGRRHRPDAGLRSRKSDAVTAAAAAATPNRLARPPSAGALGPAPARGTLVVAPPTALEAAGAGVCAAAARLALVVVAPWSLVTVAAGVASCAAAGWDAPGHARNAIAAKPVAAVKRPQRAMATPRRSNGSCIGSLPSRF